MSHAVNWFQIQGPNGHALQQFYKKVFGWKMKELPGSDDSMMVASEPGGIAGGIGTSHNHQPSVAVYVSVGDIDAVFGKIQRGGGRMAMPKTELPGYQDRRAHCRCKSVGQTGGGQTDRS
ncbi:MAG TPA: hypothetical protein VLT33_22280, partial [Labilithrix sp.]|nr:hypothetical protein [Labilithrix sp.]